MPRATTDSFALIDLSYFKLDETTVIWVDPGASTGWALWDATGRFASGQHEAFTVENLLYDVLTRNSMWIQLGWEQYLITPGSRISHDGSAVRVIGFLEWAARHTGCEVLKPMPSSARSLGQDGAKLQALGWHKPGKRDANAAAAHLLAHLLREKLLPRETLRALTEGWA